jgi:hypothetical protein
MVRFAYNSCMFRINLPLLVRDLILPTPTWPSRMQDLTCKYLQFGGFQLFFLIGFV